MPKPPRPSSRGNTPSNCPCRTRLPDRRTRIPKPPRPSGRGNIPTSCLWYISRADLRNAPHDNSREGSRGDPCEETARRRFRRRGHPRSAACRPEGAPARTTSLKSTFSSSIGLLLQFSLVNIPGYCARCKKSAVNISANAKKAIRPAPETSGLQTGRRLADRSDH